MKIRCMIVDDQSQSAELMADHVKKSHQLELKVVTTNPIEALAYLDMEFIDCIFLDIEMPEINGLEFIETVKAKYGTRMPKIVLITAYDRYALAGYDYGVFDYLLKPVSFKRFKISIDRLLAEPEQSEVERDFLFVDANGKKLRINFNEIIYVEGAGNYIVIATQDKKVICYKTMSGIMGLLPHKDFVRVHKSFIVAASKINAIQGNEVLTNIGGSIKNLPIGTTYKESLLKLLRINE
jgi:two-component system LytT family response regulator